MSRESDLIAMFGAPTEHGTITVEMTREQMDLIHRALAHVHKHMSEIRTGRKVWDLDEVALLRDMSDTSNAQNVTPDITHGWAF